MIGDVKGKSSQVSDWGWGKRSLSEEGTSEPEQRAWKSCGGATLRTLPQRHARGSGQRLTRGRADWLGCLGKGKWKNGGCLPGHNWGKRDAVYLDVKTGKAEIWGKSRFRLARVKCQRPTGLQMPSR